MHRQGSVAFYDCYAELLPLGYQRPHMRVEIAHIISIDNFFGFRSESPHSECIGKAQSRSMIATQSFFRLDTKDPTCELRSRTSSRLTTSLDSKKVQPRCLSALTSSSLFAGLVISAIIGLTA